VEGWLHQATSVQPTFSANIRDQAVSHSWPEEAKYKHILIVVVEVLQENLSDKVGVVYDNDRYMQQAKLHDIAVLVDQGG
jgi:hypothetical protein